ncbi:MAG: hypothetical protein PHP64_07500 [Actinomycetota bacterium]|nr:hypothetical protein [Actinomycetota bacterium]
MSKQKHLFPCSKGGKNNMSKIDEILQSKIKPKEKQIRLVEAVCQKKITVKEFIGYFVAASDVNKGACADAMKHISASNPEILASYIDTLLPYINYKLPRVNWGVQEAIGNMAMDYPDKVAKAIPYLLKNTTDDKINTTVIKWCAAFALSEIAKNNPKTRKQLLPIFEKIIKSEENNGVKNVYLKTLKILEKEK